MSGSWDRCWVGIGLLLSVSCAKQGAVEAPDPPPDWVVNSAAVVLEDGTGTATGSAGLVGVQQDAAAIAESKARFELTRLLGCSTISTTTLASFTDTAADPDTLWVQVVGTCQQAAPAVQPSPASAPETPEAEATGDASEEAATTGE